MTFVLPHLSDDGTSAWTRSARFHPNDKDTTNELAVSLFKREFFSTPAAWNIGRLEGTRFPPKPVEDSSAFRDGGIWSGTIIAPRLANQEKSAQGQKDRAEGKLNNRPLLNTPKKELWPAC